MGMELLQGKYAASTFISCDSLGRAHSSAHYISALNPRFVFHYNWHSQRQYNAVLPILFLNMTGYAKQAIKLVKRFSEKLALLRATQPFLVPSEEQTTFRAKSLHSGTRGHLAFSFFLMERPIQFAGVNPGQLQKKNSCWPEISEAL